MCTNFLPAYSSAKIILKKPNKFFQSYGHNCTATFFMKHSVDRCRSRLRGMHYGTLEQQRGAMKHVGGSGETYMETRRQLLKVVLHYIASSAFVG